MNYHFKKAQLAQLPAIWEIIQAAIVRRKKDGSKQWQDGYPNPEVLQNDIENEVGFVLTNEQEIIGYCAVMINDEPQYSKIEGNWLTNGDFVVIHRLAISEKYLGKGYAQKMMVCVEDYALQNNIFSIKIDTNFDNAGMLQICQKMGYTFCGHVYFRGGQRKAFEKVLQTI